MSEKKRLTRDSEIYNDAIRMRVINESDFDSSFTELVGLDYSINYKCKLSWKSLSESHTFRNVTPDRLRKLESLSKVDLAVEAGKSSIGHTWRGTGETVIEVEPIYKVELPDSEVITLVSSFTIRSDSHRSEVGDLLSSIRQNENVSIEIKNEKVTVNLDSGTSIKATEYDGKPNYKVKDTTFSDNLEEYLCKNEQYVEAEIGELEHDEDIIYVPVKFSDAEIRYEFKNPESNQAFWDLAEQLGNGDPLLMSSTSVYVSLEHITYSDNVLIQNGLFSIHSKKPSTYVGIIGSFKKLISRL